MSLLWLKLKTSFRAVGRVLIKPSYGLLAILYAVLILGVLLWIFNLNLLYYVFTEAPLSWGEKLGFLVKSYAGIWTNFDNLLAVVLLKVSILMGINLSLLTFVLRRQSKAKLTASGGAAGAAVLSAGCAACGTGILGPLLGALGASASVGLIHTIGLAANLLAIALTLYSIYSLGKVAAGLSLESSLSH